MIATSQVAALSRSRVSGDGAISVVKIWIVVVVCVRDHSIKHEHGMRGRVAKLRLNLRGELRTWTQLSLVAHSRQPMS